MYYSPFPRSLRDLETADLQVLREVAEGWYIEYKREVPNIKSIAKSLSAFANHYGGWLFYGIQEDSKANPVAGTFPGIAKSDIARAEQSLRDAASAHVNPPPYFEHRVLEGPSPEIGLPDDSAIIVVMIPQGLNAPYVHSTGRIYRRVADQSDPVPETDRSVLDLLWERGRRERDRLAERLLDTPERLEIEKNTYAHIHILSDPLGHRGRLSKISFRDVVHVFHL